MFQTLCMVGPRIRKTSSVPGRRKAGAAVDDSTHRLIIVSLTLPHEVLELKQVLRALCAYAQGGMAIQLATILPALICAHVLGLVMLLYSLEKTFGIISRTRRRLRLRIYRGVAAELCETERSETSPRTVEERAPFGFPALEHRDGSSQGKAAVQGEPAHCAVNEPWIRGCRCQVGHAANSTASQHSTLSGCLRLQNICRLGC